VDWWVSGLVAKAADCSVQLTWNFEAGAKQFLTVSHVLTKCPD